MAFFYNNLFMTTTPNCYCGSNENFTNCCEPYIKGTKKVPTAEALMRSRYSAYAVNEVDYLWFTTAPSEREHHTKAAILEWSKSNHWLKLEIINATAYTVTFKAYYLDNKLIAQVHYEKSRFVLENENWFYLDGEY